MLGKPFCCTPPLLNLFLCLSHRMQTGAGLKMAPPTTHTSCSVGDKVALVDASHEKFHDLWMETLEKQLKALGGCNLDAWVVATNKCPLPDASMVCSSPMLSTELECNSSNSLQYSSARCARAQQRAAVNLCATAVVAGTMRRDKIDYIFVSHTEPDHSGLIPSVLDRHPEATVCGSKVALTFLQVGIGACVGEWVVMYRCRAAWKQQDIGIFGRECVCQRLAGGGV
eukprot:1147598-Pelagomonas_calceolata.AAC.2